MSMDASPSAHRRPEPRSCKDLHPVVYGALGAAVLWFVLAVWGFSGQGYADYLLAIVSGFFVVAVAIPSILLHVGKALEVRESAHEDDGVPRQNRLVPVWARAGVFT